MLWRISIPLSFRKEVKVEDLNSPPASDIRRTTLELNLFSTKAMKCLVAVYAALFVRKFTVQILDV